MTTSTITRATAAEIPLCAHLVAKSFEALPQTVWLIDKPAARLPALTASFTILVEHALEHGRVDLISDQAVAVWFHRDREVPEPRDYEARVAAGTGEYASRFQLLDEAFESHHPAAPHHHLALLAVHPEHQNKGLGGALLADYHARLDREGTAAFLEASTLASSRLYQRYGYRPLGEPYNLPDGPAMYPLWREPAA
ncbi:GNAT family N-acetyltransferase [Actinokineospora auranticolor]|uniref:Acetyltransferase (GNAT) family protein n=1 Tax=Actinokineospora auranticolor TaxID=155976 RepID=A0A2S6GPP0_9PSEU|nr:GNAT family N-acetyltransferase [Actinokineospora auranticolor]PPK67166.1 acetyltransferase (GNAT) family protein [Actinokineospora auranticolor]